MKKKEKTLTVILTILFSFAITSVVCAECIVEILPSNPTVSLGGTIQFTAVTQGEGCNQPNYTWEMVESDCTAPSWIDETGLYTATSECNCDCFQDVIKVTDTTNGNIFAEATISIAGCCYPEVAIIPDGAALCNFDCQTFTIEPIGWYNDFRWKLDGIVIGTGDSIEICGFDVGDGEHTLTLDESISHSQDNITITVGGPACCSVDVEKDQVWRSRWVPFPAVIAIHTYGFDVSQRSQVAFDCASPLSVIKLVKLVSSNAGIINQFAIIMPTFLTGNSQGDTETCTVIIEGCEQNDVFKLDILNLGHIPFKK